MEYVRLAGEKRELGKSKIAKKLRSEGKIPCNLYGIEGNVNFSTTALAVRDLIYTPEFKIAKIEIDGKEYPAIVKDVTFHPINDSILHIDFLALTKGHPIKVQIPVVLEGVAAGIGQGGKLFIKLRKVLVVGKSENLVDKLTLDITSLNIGDIGRVKDVALPEGLSFLTPESSPIAFIKRPRVVIETEEEEEEEESTAEAASE